MERLGTLQLLFEREIKQLGEVELYLEQQPESRPDTVDQREEQAHRHQ